MDGTAIDHHYTHAVIQVNVVSREAWVLALNGDDIFSPRFMAALEAAGWRWVTLRDAHGGLTEARGGGIALLSVDRFTSATYGLIRFVAGVLDLPIVVFSSAASLSNVCKSLRAGAEDFIAIPYAPEEAIARLNSVLNGRYRITAHVAFRHVDPDGSGRGATGGERQ